MTTHTFMFILILPVCFNISSPIFFVCRESNWLHMMLCLPCVLWCSWGLRSRAMRWGPFATISMCAMFSHSLSKLSEDLQHDCFEGASGSEDIWKYINPKIKLKVPFIFKSVLLQNLRFITVYLLYKYVLPSPVHNRNYTFMQNNYWVAHFLPFILIYRSQTWCKKLSLIF